MATEERPRSREISFAAEVQFIVEIISSYMAGSGYKKHTMYEIKVQNN